jgi:predicted outer membrane repeat protein
MAMAHSIWNWLNSSLKNNIKHITMKRTNIFLMILACFCMQQLNAKDIYLSASGNDANNGLSSDKAVKTLLRVNEIVDTEDVIHVSGIIKITDEPDFETKINDGTQEPPNPENGIYLYHRGYYIRYAMKWAGVTFLGSDPDKDGFSGEYRAPLFQLDGAAPLTFKNIKLTKAVTHRAATGLYGSDVSAIWAVNTDLTLINCIVSENDVARKVESPADPVDGWGDRGAIMVAGGTAYFYNCQFVENMAKEGGALYLQGGNVTVDKCDFAYNNCAEINDSKGGAIHTWVHGNNSPLYAVITRCLFEGNTASKGGAIALLDKVSYTQTSTTLVIDRCSFVGNQATSSMGGAILWDNFMGRQTEDIISIYNSLFYGNSANDYGGAICVWNVQPGSELYMNNVTVYGNYTSGNSGHGPGLSFMDGYETYKPNNLKKQIYNCIFDGNYATGGEISPAFSDLGALYAPELYNDDFVMKNCYVGSSINMLGHAGISASDNMINYYTEALYDESVAGFDDPDYYGQNYSVIPLLENSSARTYGDIHRLMGEKDLSGKQWTITDGACAIGSCDVTSQEVDDEIVFEEDRIVANKAAEGIKLAVTDGLIRCFNSKGNTAQISIYNMNGTRVAQGNNSFLLPKLPTGTYVVKVKVAETVYSQKMIIK